jgi:uncharacterized cupin superfamily protein
MPKIDIAAVPQRQGAGYPPPFDAPCAERVRQRLGNAGGLTDFGSIRACRRSWSTSATGIRTRANSSMCRGDGADRDGSETVLRAGDCAAFPRRRRRPIT